MFKFIFLHKNNITLSICKKTSDGYVLDGWFQYKEYDKVLAYAESEDIRFIVCNTTEAGIQYDPACQKDDVPTASYPGKLTQWLYRRYQKFGQVEGKGVIILSCEQI